MHWLKRIFGFKEPETHPASDPDPITKGGKIVEKQVPPEPKRKFANACEENDAFINEHWNLYPDYIQEHILNYREITRLENLYDKYEWELRGYMSGMERYIQLARDAKYADIKLPGTEKIIAEYEAKIQAMRERFNALPDIQELREKNIELEKRAAEDGWIWSCGYGGLHWNKKGVVQDGSKIF